MIRLLPFATRAAALLALTVSLALFADPAVAAAKHRSARGTVVVRISAPRGVAASVVLHGHHRHRRVLAKRASKRRRRFTLKLAVGRERVSAPVVVAKGKVYAAQINHKRFRVRRRRKVSLRVRYHALAVATGLKAVSISQTNITLGWKTKHKRVRLRRADGAVAPSHVGDGVAVPTSHGHATDQGLQPETVYSYALFTRVRGHWAAPVTLQAGTASSGTAASYTAPPTTTIVRAGQPYGVSVNHHKVSVTLPSGQPTPVLGAGFVVPISRELQGGFVGKVASISPDGRTVTLTQAGLAQVFSSYHLDTPITGTSKLSPQLRRQPGLRPQAEGAPDCNGNASDEVEFGLPPIKWGGHAGLSFPGPNIELSIDASAAFSMSETISTTGQLSCEQSIDKVVKTISADPVPLSVVVEPEVKASIGGKIEAKDITESATIKLTADAEGGLSGLHADAHLQKTGDVDNETEAEVSAPIDASIGAEMTLGPGAGSDDAGVIAGISGELDPVEVSLDPSLDAKGGDACLVAALGGEASLGFEAEAFIGDFGGEVSVPLFSKQWTYGSPLHVPTGCKGAPGSGTVPRQGNPADQRVANLAVERIGDFPSGWSQSGETHPAPATDCGRKALALNATATANSPRFDEKNGDGSTESVAYIDRTAADATSAYAQFSSPATQRCLLRDAIHGLAGLTIGNVSGQALATAPVGDQSTATRFTIPVSNFEGHGEITADLVFVRSGRGVEFMLFASSGPFPLGLERHVTSTVTGRLANGLASELGRLPAR